MICQDEAIVLRSRDFRETSKIAIFYTRKHGKLSGLFKGFRRDPKKFATHLDFLSVNEIVFYKKRFSELHLVSQCDLRRDFNAISHDMEKFTLASFCAELIESIMPVEYAHEDIYDLFLKALTSICDPSNTNIRKMLYSFTLKTLAFSGFKPHLDNCVLCQDPITQKAFFSNHFGGLLCEKCVRQDAQSESILAGAISTILFLQKKDWAGSMRLHILPSVEKQLSNIIFSFLNFNLEHKFKTLKVLNESFQRKVPFNV
ncbi:DNA repair protein RecO [Thermoproteota archaeon]